MPETVARTQTPMRAWVVVFSGTAINLCLGILYAWSIWKANLIGKAEYPPGTAMTGLNEGWHYLTDAQATWAYAICGITFALFMIPGGILQDRLGPRLGATLGGLFLGGGCLIAGFSRSYWGLVGGFGLMGGIGMGLGYAAATPAAVKWFGPERRGLVAGLVVGGYGAAAIYIAPLAEFLIGRVGISGTFIGLGIFFSIVVVGAAQLLATPPSDYQPAAPANSSSAPASVPTGMSMRQMLGTWQFYAMVVLFVASAQSGLLVIANAKGILQETTQGVGFLAANAWLLASFGGFINAAGRVGTGVYSDKIGRQGAYLINGLASVACLFLTPTIMHSGSVALVFLTVGVAFWQYGGGLSLMPAMTADYFGANDLGSKYGLVFLGWGIAFFVPQLAGYLRDMTGTLDTAFYISGTLMFLAVILSRFVTRPTAA
ncbi:putative MFS-type transporter YhjX [Planctomycetes bacterium Pan216]|uniref:Putative MFS-type transporter YhjX n=1 Tax=Kolteria novifilia TaxID=2527975 RepID=A0A518B2A5_9BACT|nr:putative MFS-type transporter YhjX [Planctomycetes bacterium Pan216]